MSKKGEVLHPFDHALKRPDTYIGSSKTFKKEKWIWSGELAELKTIRFNQGLFNIVREICSNAMDNKWRSEGSDVPMTKIKITVDIETGEITIWNNGYSIPVERVEYTFKDYRKNSEITEELYPAEIFFGEMGAGTNFDDEEKRKTSGRNGMGAKAANVFSKSFVIEHYSPDHRKRFVQEYWENGKKHSEPNVTFLNRKLGYTQITFTPDYEYFGYPSRKEPGIDENFISILKMYAYEMAMITNIPIVFNEEILRIRNLEQYVRLFYPDKNQKSYRFETKNGDECVVIEKLNPEEDVLKTISHMSFVNGVRTSNGGVHVNEWASAIIPPFVAQYNKRKPKKGEVLLKVTGDLVKPYLMFFIRIEVENPGFSSQTKDELTEVNGKASGYKITKTNEWKKELEKAFKVMMKWEFIEHLEDKLQAKADQAQKKKEGNSNKRLAMGKKLNDANKAGTKDSHKCILYITEGLSAKAFAARGIGSDKNKDGSGKGQDFAGAFAIQGKFINVQNNSSRMVNNNKEVEALKKILGLRHGLDYSKKENFDTLRYGKVCILTDADDDGIHIRGLLLNFFYTLYPTLLDRNYVVSFSTAVVRAFIGASKAKQKELLFYSNPEFKKWYEENKDSKILRGNPKYYKGLGSIDPKDVSTYFKDPKIVTYFMEGDEKEYMDLGFNDKQSDWRKTWISRDMENDGEIIKWMKAARDVREKQKEGSDSEEEIDLYSEDEQTSEPDFIYEGDLGLSTFVDKQLIIYHRGALSRALPGIDGLKVGQRKILFALRQIGSKTAKDVERISGAVKERTGYHHGAASLQGSIIKMAQGFVGTNNIPLLVNEGEMGTRLEGGADAAQARYPSTMLEEITNVIYPPEDDALLEQKIEDNIPVEYTTYMPIIPMILVNGAKGIASGWSTEIPCYNPDDLVKWIELWLNGKEPTKYMELVPWYRGFKGEIELIRNKEKSTPVGWVSKGILEKSTNPKEKGWWHIRELPIGLWTSVFKEWLDYLSTGNTPKDKKWGKLQVKCLQSVKEYVTANTVHFMIKPTKEFLPDIDTAGNFKNLIKTKSLNNMIIIDEKDYPYKFESAEDIIRCFCMKRLTYYTKRKEHLLKLWKDELLKDNNRYKFVKAVGIDKKLDLYKEDGNLEEEMEDKWKFDRINGNYNYLLHMQINSLTKKKADELKRSIEKWEKQIDDLENKTDKDLWREDLKKFKIAYKKFLKTRREE
jgi:DNA topoisomerase II